VYAYFQIATLGGLIILHALYADTSAPIITLKHVIITLNLYRDARLNFPDLGDAEDGEEDTLEETASGNQETSRPWPLSLQCCSCASH
jgi:hypothetical protein